MDIKTIHVLIVWILSASCQRLHCNRCHCYWMSGRKMANCVGRSFNTIPDDLSVGISEIDFSFNFVYSLEREIFSKAHLSDAEMLRLEFCMIGKVHELAFSGLRILLELDLDNNNIESLKKNVFRDNVKLRTLRLSRNMIKVLEDGLFHNLTFLQNILLDNNLIETITEQTFQALPALEHISLEHNKIQRITFDMKANLPKLRSLSVEGNPWICDCQLRDFRKSALQNNLVATSITCQSPLMLRGSSWSDNIEYACEPKVVEAGPYATIEAQTPNISLTCKVVGEPTPDVDWMTNGAIIERDPRKNWQKYSTSKDTIDGFTWNNLTIINVTYKDCGEYRCIAKNPVGEDSKKVTVLLPTIIAFEGSGITSTYSAITYWIIGFSIGFLLVLLIVPIIFCFYKNCTHGFHSMKRGHAGSSEEVGLSTGQADIKKRVITDVNQATKPPCTTVPPPVVSGRTEVSDVKRNLLDNESVFERDHDSPDTDLESEEHVYEEVLQFSNSCYFNFSPLFSQERV